MDIWLFYPRVDTSRLLDCICQLGLAARRSFITHYLLIVCVTWKQKVLTSRDLLADSIMESDLPEDNWMPTFYVGQHESRRSLPVTSHVLQQAHDCNASGFFDTLWILLT